MKLLSISIKRYRSLRDESIEFGDLNVFVGANASGKSAILDALRFLREGVSARDFRTPAFARGGIVHLAWKGEEAGRIDLDVRLGDGEKNYDWSIHFIRENYDFSIQEQIHESTSGSPPVQMLDARGGEGWWWSGKRGERVPLKQSSTVCALASAAADASFPARGVVDFVGRWGFFDPSPFLLRRDWTGLEASGFDPYGRNLGETLHGLPRDVLEKVVSATRDILGLPTEIEPREAENRFYFVQKEPGLQYSVHQMGVSSGTLRILALMTALLAEPRATLIGIEEPENYVHPSALSSFAATLLAAKDRVQFAVTTHSPLLLDCIDAPEDVRVVRRDMGGTSVAREENPDGVRRALEESGFGLGEFYQTKGFGTG